jgi:phytoene dehydrogenase-like protein
MTANNKDKAFDLIVIGSGIGGLTTAAILAKLYKKKVLVLEQHYTPGGFTHGFDRKGKFHWDVGVHYVGEMGKGELGKAVFDYITDGRLKWQKMPDPFDRFVYPDFTFNLYADPKRYQADLIYQFPDERKAIKQYFRDVKKATFCFLAYAMLDLFPGWVNRLLKRSLDQWGAIARQTNQQYFDRCFQDSRLKGLLQSQWGDYGLPPSQACFGEHCNVVSHFLKGAWYPVGGGAAIAPSIMPTIEQAGGKVMTRRRVTEILVKKCVAVGVKVQHVGHPETEPEIYSAPTIISDAGAVNTYLKLLPSDYPLSERESIKAFPKGTNLVSLYLGLKESPKKIGFQGENHWIHTTYNHDDILKTITESVENPPQFCFLSFPSMKNPLSKGHTAEIIAGIDYRFFTQWKAQAWKHRDEDYTKLKTKITALLIHSVESSYPGFQDLIEYAELATPLTFEHFSTSDQGVVYGIPWIPERLDLSWTSTKTPIKNLYLTGVDTFPSGIMGAMMSGVKTAGIVNGGFGFFKIMANVMT